MRDRVLVGMAPELKERLARVAKLEGKTSSEVIRALVEDYLKQRDIGAYIDSLWERLGKDARAGKLADYGHRGPDPCRISGGSAKKA